jgi:hypothetical protein
METYPIGQTVRISTATAFTDADGDPVAPDTVTLTVLAPDGTETTPSESAGASTGLYYADVTVDQAGVWAYRWEGVIGTSTAVDEDLFLVTRSWVT